MADFNNTVDTGRRVHDNQCGDIMHHETLAFKPEWVSEHRQLLLNFPFDEYDPQLTYTTFTGLWHDLSYHNGKPAMFHLYAKFEQTDASITFPLVPYIRQYFDDSNLYADIYPNVALVKDLESRMVIETYYRMICRSGVDQGKHSWQMVNQRRLMNQRFAQNLDPVTVGMWCDLVKRDLRYVLNKTPLGHPENREKFDALSIKLAAPQIQLLSESVSISTQMLLFYREIHDATRPTVAVPGEWYADKLSELEELVDRLKKLGGVEN